MSVYSQYANALINFIKILLLSLLTKELSTICPPVLAAYSLSYFPLLNSSSFAAHSFASQQLPSSAHTTLQVKILSFSINYANGYSGGILYATKEILSYCMVVQHAAGYSNRVQQLAHEFIASALSSRISQASYIIVG